MIFNKSNLKRMRFYQSSNIGHRKYVYDDHIHITAWGIKLSAKYIRYWNCQFFLDKLMVFNFSIKYSKWIENQFFKELDKEISKGGTYLIIKAVFS